MCLKLHVAPSMSKMMTKCGRGNYTEISVQSSDGKAVSELIIGLKFKFSQFFFIMGKIIQPRFLNLSDL